MTSKLEQMDKNITNNKTEIYQARVIGSFFLLAFLAYGFGRHFFESQIISEKYLGSTLIITNSIMVIFIGILFRKTLKEYNVLVANIYLFTRIFEAVALASIVLSLIPNFNISEDNGYFLAMLILGLGSIPMCWTLYKQAITPSWLAIWGLIGYAVFAFGFLVEFFGKEWSMYLLAFGGLWEIIFAIWLIVKGGQNERTTNR
jgi:hypothetical protein